MDTRDLRWMLDSMRLVKACPTSLGTVHSVYMESNGICLTRTYGSNFARNESTYSLTRNVQQESRLQLKYAADASMLIECFEVLTLQLKRLFPSGACKEYRAPVLAVSVRAVVGLPKGRHAPKVAFVLQVPGALVRRYVSADNVEDISPSFDEASHFIMKDYSELTKDKSITLEIWDRNLLGNELVGAAELATSTRSMNPLPSKSSSTRSDLYK